MAALHGQMRSRWVLLLAPVVFITLFLGASGQSPDPNSNSQEHVIRKEVSKPTTPTSRPSIDSISSEKPEESEKSEQHTKTETKTKTKTKVELAEEWMRLLDQDKRLEAVQNRARTSAEQDYIVVLRNLLKMRKFVSQLEEEALTTTQAELRMARLLMGSPADPGVKAAHAEARRKSKLAHDALDRYEEHMAELLQEASRMQLDLLREDSADKEERMSLEQQLSDLLGFDPVGWRFDDDPNFNSNSNSNSTSNSHSNQPGLSTGPNTMVV